MARYVPEDQSKLLPVIFSQQITPGTFEHTVTFLIDEHLDMSMFDARYKNDETGRPAYNPAMLLRLMVASCHRTRRGDGLGRSLSWTRNTRRLIKRYAACCKNTVRKTTLDK